MNRFSIDETPIAGVKIIKRKALGDERGWFERSFCAEELKAANWTRPLAQINRTFTAKKGSLRGLHFQHPPHAEDKIITCLHGKVLDLALDLRQGSPTFLQHFTITLDGAGRERLLIPRGCAHGFQTLTDNVEMMYFHSTCYAPESEGGVHPQDPRLGISWPLDTTVISERDATRDFLSDDFEGIVL